MRDRIGSSWPRAPGLKCLINDGASLTWLMIWNALLVGKKSFAVQLTILPECSHWGEMEASIEHVLFYCPVVCSLCELIKGYMVCMMCRQFFALEPK